MSSKRTASSATVSKAKRPRGVAAASAPADGDGVHLMLMKSLNRISGAAEGFKDAVATFDELNAEKIQSIKMELEALEKKRDELRHQIDVDVEEGKQRVDTELRRHRADVETKRMEDDAAVAREILAERGEVPISQSVLEDMKERLEAAEEEKNKAVAAARAEVTKAMSASMKHAEERHALVSEKETAMHTARIEQLEEDIKMKGAFIAELKDMMDKQRELTASVANSVSAQQRGPFSSDDCGSGSSAPRRR